MWYCLKNEADSSVMGDFPQTSEYVGEAKEFLSKITECSFRNHLKQTHSINYIKLKSKAKYTDFICCLKHQNSGLIISEKTYTILSNYKIYNVIFYNSVLRKNAILKKYYFMRLAGNLTEYLDFSKSIFRIYDKGKLSQEFMCLNLLDFQEKRINADSINPLYVHELYFKPEFYELNYDCIFLGELDAVSILINEKLKTRLESEKLTGMVIEPYTIIKN